MRSRVARLASKTAILRFAAILVVHIYLNLDTRQAVRLFLALFASTMTRRIEFERVAGPELD